MSQDYDMLDGVLENTIDLIIEEGEGINDAIDAMILAYDLTPNEQRAMIYFMAQKGYRYTNKGAQLWLKLAEKHHTGKIGILRK